MMVDDESPILDPMGLPEKARLHKTAERTKQVYPGVVGEILADFLDSWIEFGYKLGYHSRVNQLHRHVWKVSLPGDSDRKPDDEWTEIA